MAAGTVLTYNGVTINNCLILQFDEELVYDDSKTDALYKRIMVRVRGVVHTGTTSNTGITSSNAAAPGSRYLDISQRLLETRGDFSLVFAGGGGFTVNAGTDLNNGPKPERFPILRVAPASFLVEFSIELACACCQSNKNAQGVLSNRWSTEEERDEDGFMTITTSGRLRVKYANLDPQSFRGLVLPGLFPGFQRQRIRMLRSVDGLTLDYTITDIQRFGAPPKPATSWSGTHILTTGKGGAQWFEEVSIRLGGGPNVPKTALIAEAVHVGLNKLDVLNRTQGDAKYGWFLNSATIIDTLEKNAIEFRIQIQKTPANPSLYTGLDATTLGKGIKPSQSYGADWPRPVTYPTNSAAGNFLCYLQNPCDDNHDINGQTSTARTGGGSASSSGSGSTAGSASGTLVETLTGTLPTDQKIANNYSLSHKQHHYTFYQIDTKYETDDLKAQLPLGGDSEPTCVVVSFGKGLGRILVKLSAERIGDWPELPSSGAFIEGGLIGTKMKHWVETKTPTYGPDGQQTIYSLDAYYRYALSRPYRDGDIIGSVKLPFLF